MNYYLIEDICVCCGVPVPEGTMVCPNCEKRVRGEGKTERSQPGKRKETNRFGSKIRRWITKK